MGTPHQLNVYNALQLGPLIDPDKYKDKKPNKVIPVPPEYRRQTLGREGANLIYDIRVGANCHVVLQWDKPPAFGGRYIIAFEIYGAGADVERGVSRINQWIFQAHVKSRDASAWAKIPAYNPDDWYYQQIEAKQNARKALFRGPVPPSDHPDAPKHAEVLDWPQMFSEDSLSPRDVFGNKIERLDTLRMQDEVWFILDQDEAKKWKIVILGHGQSHVELAKEHLEAHLTQVRAETSGINYGCNVFLDRAEGNHVELQQNEEWWPNQVDRVVPRLLPGPSIMDEPGTFRRSPEGLSAVHLSLAQSAIKLALDKVRGRKGSYDFAVRLGCIALKAKHVSEDKIGQTFKRDVFVRDIETKVELDVKKWLTNDDVGYRMLLRFMDRDDVFEPTRSGGYFGFLPKVLQEIRPTFRGAWVFRDPNIAVSLPREAPRHSGRPVPMRPSPAAQETSASTPASFFLIELDWTEDEGDQYEKGTPRYFKFEAGKSGLTKNMEVNLLELGESRAWHFALESKIPVPDNIVPPVLKGFAERVTMRPNYDTRSTESFAQWDPTPTVKQHLETGRLDSVYMFGIKGTDYKAELTAMWYPRQKKPVWGLSVRHLDWASHLAELECLPIGTRASWGDTVPVFFPEDEQLSLNSLSLENDRSTKESVGGLSILTKKLLEISDVVSSVTNEGGIGI